MAGVKPRSRLRAAGAAVRDRLDEPLERAGELSRLALAAFPVRVWRHFLQHNGFLLAAGVSYQALFAVFAAIYVTFAIAGIWLGGSPAAIDGLINVINDYIPGMISDDGVFTSPQVANIAADTAGVLGVTGAVALAALMWTAIGFVTFARKAVRDIFAIVPDTRNYLRLKVVDLLTAVAFGLALLAGSVLNGVATWALDYAFTLAGWSTSSPWFQLGLRAATVIVSVALNTLTLGVLFRYLTGTALSWRMVWPGATLGGTALSVLQLGAGLLVAYSPTNPLLATFAFFIGLLLWFRIVGVIILVAASWIAVSARDSNLPLLLPTEDDRRAQEHRARVTAARVRLRDATAQLDAAPWYRIRAARHRVDRAVQALAEAEAAAGPASRRQ